MNELDWLATRIDTFYDPILRDESPEKQAGRAVRRQLVAETVEAWMKGNAEAVVMTGLKVTVVESNG